MSISISSIRASKSSFFLILLFNNNLRETRITIKKTKMGLFRQPFQHLINKRKRVVIFLSNFINFPKIDAHPIAYYYSLRNKLIIIISDNGNTSLFRNTMNRTNPFTISNRVNNTSIKEFQYLVPYHFLHPRI